MLCFVGKFVQCANEYDVNSLSLSLSLSSLLSLSLSLSLSLKGEDNIHKLILFKVKDSLMELLCYIYIKI